MLGHLITLGVLLAAGGVAFGVLRQTVKQMPTQMRLEMKLEFKNGMDAHLDKYAHDEKEVSAVRPRPPEILAG